MRVVPVILGVALICVTGGAVAALLPACSVVLPFNLAAPQSCVIAGAREAALQDEAADAERAALSRKIAMLERDLGRARCLRAPAPQASAPAIPDTPSGIDPDAFDARDMRAMEGCWELDSEYRARDPQTGKVTDFTEWNICLDATGAGSQTMRAVDGTTCSGSVSAGFGDDGSFSVIEPVDLQCSNDTFIYRRETSCRLTADGRALCEAVQPEQNTRAPATLRRAKGDL
jgi:hypothetical protein